MRCFYHYGGEYRIRTGDLLPARKRITTLYRIKKIHIHLFFSYLKNFVFV